MLSPARKMRRGFPDKRREGAGKMGAVIARHVGVILRQISADGLGVYALKVVIGFAVRGHRQIEIPGAHAQRTQTCTDDGIGAEQSFRCQHGGALGAILAHDFEPANVLPSHPIVDDMGPVHHGRGMQGRGRIAFIGRDHQPFILPVIQVFGGIAAHTPMPDAVLPIGMLLVLAVPVVDAVFIQNRPAMGLNALSCRIQPHLAGTNGCVHVYSSTMTRARARFSTWVKSASESPLRCIFTRTAAK